MKFLSLLTASLTFAIFSASTMAVQVSVEDISNTPPTCNLPILDSIKPGLCLAVHPGTLKITASLEKNENPKILDNIHVIVENNGQHFQYLSQGNADHSDNWQKTSVTDLVGTPLVASFQRAPWQTDTVVQEITLGKFYKQKGTKVYVGVRANDTAGFLDGSVKEAFVIK